MPATFSLAGPSIEMATSQKKGGGIRSKIGLMLSEAFRFAPPVAEWIRRVVCGGDCSDEVSDGVQNLATTPQTIQLIQRISTLGRPGSEGVREIINTSADDAYNYFKQLTVNAVEVVTTERGAIVARLADGTYITYRAASSQQWSGGVPTIDINSPLIGLWKLKFLP
jgi:hypothetical protein